ncbi:hypothetical protein CC80DRAFT_435461 [Byssothecium circinans]|uniref:Cora-domain-containing protein n=1 Tax=Byssothecium circinans TaxID=147558 RepID=A0A6A5UFE4_9PLEO|nr:hypothetical protein CC80DRAFT_435461 [Byssothecium circinans]
MTTTNRVTHPVIEVLRKRHAETTWDRREVSLDTIQELKDPPSFILGDFDLTLVVAGADQIRECSEWRRVFTQQFRIPEIWWAHALKNSNGYFGHEYTRDATGSLDGCNTWFRALVKQTHEHAQEGQKDYIWYKHNIFTRWLASTSQTILLVFDPKPVVRQRLLSAPLYISSLSTSDPYWIYDCLLEDLIDLQDKAVWGIRTLVRQTEIHRNARLGAPPPDFLRLHDIARHAIHVSETLDVAVTTIKMVSACHEGHLRAWPASEGREKEKSTHALLQSKLQFYDHMLRSLRHRAASNKDRLNNEIQYAFNAVTQYDSRVTVEIGRAAQSDSAAMKTISFLTLTFFPATYVCAIFSMSFFNYSPESGKWRVSSDFWIYWVVAVPITLGTALLWKSWNKLFPPKLIGEDRRPPRGGEAAKMELHLVKEKLAHHGSVPGKDSVV